MPKIVRNEIEYSSTTSTANQINYLNTTSGLSATNVQDAIDEVKSDIPLNSDFSLSGLSDVTINAAGERQVIGYNGSSWVNKTIGTFYDGTENNNSLNLVSGTVVQVNSITLNKGIYIITAFLNTESNSTGCRQLAMDANGQSPSRYQCVCVPACNKDQYIEYVRSVYVTADNTTIKFYGFQNSGSTLQTWSWAQAVKIV